MTAGYDFFQPRKTQGHPLKHRQFLDCWHSQFLGPNFFDLKTWCSIVPWGGGPWGGPWGVPGEPPEGATPTPAQGSDGNGAQFWAPNFLT